MSCESIRPQLVEFHFGVARDRAAIEEHLVGCTACLRELFDTKRAIETGEDGPRPSDAARARLRAAVAEIVQPRRRRWERPVAFAFATVALVVSLMTVRSLTGGPGAPPYAMSPER
jgi:hypothetical protein